MHWQLVLAAQRHAHQSLPAELQRRGGACQNAPGVLRACVMVQPVLYQFHQVNRTLLSLDLAWTDLNVKGASAVAKALKVAYALVYSLTCEGQHHTDEPQT